MSVMRMLGVRDDEEKQKNKILLLNLHYLHATRYNIIRG